MPVTDFGLEYCRNYLRTQKRPDPAAGLRVRRIVFRLSEQQVCADQVSSFLERLEAFDRALVEGCHPIALEHERQSALQAFKEMAKRVKAA